MTVQALKSLSSFSSVKKNNDDVIGSRQSEILWGNLNAMSIKFGFILQLL